MVSYIERARNNWMLQGDIAVESRLARRSLLPSSGLAHKVCAPAIPNPSSVALAMSNDGSRETHRSNFHS